MLGATLHYSSMKRWDNRKKDKGGKNIMFGALIMVKLIAWSEMSHF